MRLETDAPLPSGLPEPGRNQPCGCGSGRKFKKCCWANTIARLGNVKRLLIVGAGATVEECKRSGSEPDAPLPTIANFGQRLFNESPSLQRVAAPYLRSHGVDFDATILSAYEGTRSESIHPDAFQNSPLHVYQRLEGENSVRHNVEQLFEHVWQIYGDDGDLWEALTWDVYSSTSSTNSSLSSDADRPAAFGA